MPRATRPPAPFARRALRLLAWVGLAGVALVLGLAIYVQRPSFRAALVERINVSLEGTVRGRITLGELSQLGLASARLERLEVADEHGVTVLALEGVLVHYDPLGLLGRWLPGLADEIRLAHVRVERSRVRLIPDPASSELTLVRAFGEERPRGPGSGAAPLGVALEAVELGPVAIDASEAGLGTLGVRVNRVHGSARLRGDQTTVTVQRFGVLLTLDGERWVDGTGSFAREPDGVLRATFHGFVRGTELDAAAELDAGVLAAQLEVPVASAERLRRIWPGWPPTPPLAAHVTARGPLAALALQGELRAAGGGGVDFSGSAALAERTALHLDLAARALDARWVWPGAPPTSLDASASVDLGRDASGPVLAARVTTQPTRVAALELPSLQLAARHEAGLSTAHFEASDARARIEGDARLAPDGSAEISARIERVVLDAIAELRGRVRGRADLSARVRAAEGRFRADVDGDLTAIAAGPARVPSGRVRGHLEGSLDAPGEATLDVTLAGEAIAIGSFRGAPLQRAEVRARGAWYAPALEASVELAGGARGSARARAELRGEPHLRGLELRATARDVALEVQASAWAPGSERLDVERVQISGAAGSLTGSARLAPGRLEWSARAEHLDSERLGRALGFGGSAYRGVVTGTASLSTSATESRGELTLRADDVHVQALAMKSLDARATLSGQDVHAELDALDPNLGRLTLRAAGVLDGHPLEPQAWTGATGRASLSLGQLPLWPLGLVVAQKTPVQELDGRLDVELELERTDRGQWPDVFVNARSGPLSFGLAPAPASSGGSSGGSSSEPELRRFERYGVRASAAIEGARGRGTANLQVTDEHGALVTSSGVLALDLDALVREPGRALERLLSAPLDALIRVHPRAVPLLPPPVAARDLAGSVEATLQLRGSLAEPTLSLAARGRKLQGGLAGAARAVDVTSALDYTPSDGRLRGTADVVQSDRSLVIARVEGRVPSPIEAGWRPDAVELHAAAVLNGVPLELLPAAARERLEASLYGSLAVDKAPGEPMRQRAHLEIAGLTARGHLLGNGRVTFENGPGGVRADARVGSRGAYLRASVHGAASPRGTDAPSAALEGSLSARDFDAASLSPLTSGLLSRVSGTMNADATFTFEPRGGSDPYLGIDGTARVTGGSAHIDELGLEMRDITADVTAHRTPEYTVIQIAPLSARARARNPNLEADAKLWLRGVRVTYAEANLALDDLPLSLKGVSRGIARGHVKARLERQREHLQLDVSIPDLRVRLPPSSTRSLIEIDPNPDVHVLQAREETEERPADALLWRIDFELGKSVRLQRGDLDVPLTGHPSLEYRYEVRPSGTIEAAPGGHIRLFDQNFSIDRGLVQLEPDEPDNPRIDLTASWLAPDGTTVYVDVTGRAKDATVLTRDDRGLQEVDRFYLLTGGAVTDSEIGGSAAVSAAVGQTVSLGINELFRDSLGNVALNIGTTADDRASYGASVRLSEKLSFQGSFQPASENNLQESTNDLTGTLDYRFTRRWSLRTELGTSGAAFDLLWSHRY